MRAETTDRNHRPRLPKSPTFYGCTDRSETLRIDKLVLEDSCPIAQPAAHALITTIEPELK
jgi:hypothetical protein